MYSIILVRYYLNESQTLKYINKIISKSNGNIDRVVIVNIANDFFELDDSTLKYSLDIINESSDMMDIGGYFIGINLLKENTNIENIILLNDTFFTKHPYLLLMNKMFDFEWALNSKGPVIVGVLDETTCVRSGQDSLITGVYASTFIVLLNRHAIPIFETSYLEADSYTYRNSKLGCRTFDIFINWHLGREITPYSWSKSDCEKLTEVKAKCVFFERTFSRKVISDFGFLVDINQGIFSRLWYRLLDKVFK